MEKLIIIGSGIAGLTASIYAAREGLSPLLIQGDSPGGQLWSSAIIENWPGEIKIDGKTFMDKTLAQAVKNGAKILPETVIEVDFSSQPFKIKTDKQILESLGVIIATGSTHRRLGCPGEKEFFGRGVSVCATCDGPLQKDRTVVIVGSGNTAVEEAYFLLNYAKKISFVFLGDEPTAHDPLKNRVLGNPKIDLIPNHSVTQILGDQNQISGVLIKDEKTNKITTLKTDSVFLAIGMEPNTGIFKNKLEMDAFGYIKVDEWMATSIPGVFAAGDVLKNSYKQAVSSAGQGCQAALSCSRFISKMSDLKSKK